MSIVEGSRNDRAFMNNPRCVAQLANLELRKIRRVGGVGHRVLDNRPFGQVSCEELACAPRLPKLGPVNAEVSGLKYSVALESSGWKLVRSRTSLLADGRIAHVKVPPSVRPRAGAYAGLYARRAMLLRSESEATSGGHRADKI